MNKRDAYSFLRINTILDKLRGAKYVSEVDVNTGFPNIPLELNSRKKTAFNVSRLGLF